MSFSCGKKGPPTLKAYEKPEAAAGLKAMHRETVIILSWEYSAKKDNLKEFHILRDEGSGFQKISSVGTDKNSYEDSGFKTDTAYKYKIVASSLKGITSNDSNIISVKPLHVPPAPGKVSFRAGDNAVSISWESAGDGILYNIYKSYEKGKFGITPLNSEPLKTTAYSDTVESGKSSYYVLRSLLNTDLRDEGPAAMEIEINPLDFIPSKPTGLQATKVDNEKVVLSWKENPETWVTKYRIYRKTNETEGFKLLGELSTPAFVDREKTGKKNIFRVTAVGPEKESEPSETVSVDF